MPPLLKKIAVQFGIVSTVLSILYVLGVYIVDETLFTSKWGGTLVLLVTLVIFIVGVTQYKKENGGYATFREAFSAFMLPFMMASVLGLAFNLFFYNVVDADLATRNGARQVDMMLEMPEEQLQGVKKFMGVTTNDELEEKIMKQAMATKSFTGQLKGAGMGIAFFAVIGLVVGAVMKKNRPEFE
ncbi:MAG TPA: hypothetical protein DCL07_02715 [Cryomorphaceae bacterium]|jgi:hypothetical protein|nr:MAG: hypothetical protein ABR98_01425 [Cryomorphaceae bacterium BACL7 MAG-120910-bin2]KRO68565.1 MAG: hypothetical protein ABR88_01025 [Cryomorphaceae bacterium BACL7 MAG-120322-bin74]KRO83536.1 MAG: hypothetical protein ABR87_01925 [Cryomorphaceae bacterium BACL7 MAG-121220-bin83]NQW25412.1 DUF4199 domain-containing protein [Cryomorphaceae bacterium]HAG48846.1 hypothetical protein [Cryomorphaceae bacterium]